MSLFDVRRAGTAGERFRWQGAIMKRAMLAGATVAAAAVGGLLALQPGHLPFGQSGDDAGGRAGSCREQVTRHQILPQPDGAG